MGTESRAPAVRRAREMKSLVWQRDGGRRGRLLDGLQYVPGTYAEHREIIELARGAGQRRRPLRHAHAQRGDRARKGRRRDDPIGEATGARCRSRT